MDGRGARPCRAARPGERGGDALCGNEGIAGGAGPAAARASARATARRRSRSPPDETGPAAPRRAPPRAAPQRTLGRSSERELLERFAARRDAELAQQALHVRAHGVLGDVQALRDLVRAEVLVEEEQHLELAG